MKEENDSELKLVTADKLPWLIIGLVAVFLMWISWSLFLWFAPPEWFPDLSKQSNFGEMFGGIEALFSALAFAGLIYTIILQRKELYLQRLELKQTREELKRQADELASQNRGATHERLYGENHVLLEWLANNPEVRPYFYENRPFELCVDHVQRWRILLITEMYVCFMEMIALSLHDLPSSVQSEWKRFVQGAYKLSQVLRNCLRENYDWYSQALHDIIAEIPTEDIAGLVASDLKPTIRRMIADDLDAIMGMQSEVYEACFYEERSVLLKKLQCYPEGCWVCIVGSQVVGYLFSLPTEYKNPPAINSEIDQLSKLPDCYYIHDVAVRKAHQGKRIGSLLANRAIEIAHANRFRQMALIAVQGSESFWGKHGFVVAELPEEFAFKLNTYGDSALYMERSASSGN